MEEFFCTIDEGLIDGGKKGNNTRELLFQNLKDFERRVNWLIR